MKKLQVSLWNAFTAMKGKFLIEDLDVHWLTPFE
jgi:hypothetical protein